MRWFTFLDPIQSIALSDCLRMPSSTFSIVLVGRGEPFSVLFAALSLLACFLGSRIRSHVQLNDRPGYFTLVMACKGLHCDP